MAVVYRAERAVSPSDGSTSWVVVDADYELHVASCAFLAGLRGQDRSVNTERLYASRVALFLSWCAADGVEWTVARLDQMVRFKRWLVAEPANVKAGGKQCPIRFQCAGCGFYRPDPSYLPALEEHINALKADRETAIAMDADAFVVRNLADQAAAFTQVAHTMRSRLNDLSEDERTEVEQAAAVLRKMRASRDTTRDPRADTENSLAGGRPLLPLTVTRATSTAQGTG